MRRDHGRHGVNHTNMSVNFCRCSGCQRQHAVDLCCSPDLGAGGKMASKHARRYVAKNAPHDRSHGGRVGRKHMDEAVAEYLRAGSDDEGSYVEFSSVIGPASLGATLGDFFHAARIVPRKRRARTSSGGSAQEVARASPEEVLEDVLVESEVLLAEAPLPEDAGLEDWVLVV